MSIDSIPNLIEKLQHKTAEEVMQFFAAEYPASVYLSTSFSYEDQILTQIIAHYNLNIKIFTLDTGRQFPETYDVWEKTTARYKLTIHPFYPDKSALEKMVTEKGINLFYHSIENRKLCCGVRKTEPLQRALEGCKVWVTGIRKAQSITRKDMQMISWDDQNQLIKVNPLIDWTDAQVKSYIAKHNIPYNKLHDQAFPSIGCQPCTRAISEGEDFRAGRWWWENPDNRECGLHK